MLFLLSVLATILDIARLDMWGTTNLVYLIWNLLLAWIPYIISLLFIKKDMSINRFVPFFILWILFFPNAPYLVTDVIHIASVSSPLLWYDSLLFFIFGWIGLLLGMLSLFHVHQYLKAHCTYLVSELIIFVICIISSFGIYLGRFVRWNSWDIFVNPLQLVKHSLNVSTQLTQTSAPLIFVVLFTAFLYLAYKTMYVLFNEDNNR